MKDKTITIHCSSTTVTSIEQTEYFSRPSLLNIREKNLVKIKKGIWLRLGEVCHHICGVPIAMLLATLGTKCWLLVSTGFTVNKQMEICPQYFSVTENQTMDANRGLERRQNVLILFPHVYFPPKHKQHLFFFPKNNMGKTTIFESYLGFNLLSFQH